MIARLRRCRRDRRILDEANVVTALSAMRELPILLLVRFTGLGARRLYAALVRMEQAGQVASRWSEDSGRWLYRLVVGRRAV